MKKRLVAFGDSITRGESGGTVLPEQNWLNVLGKLLGDSYEVFNAGVGGNSAREAMARYQNDVLAHNPDVILLEFGGNNNDPNKPERRVDDDEFKQHLADFKAGLPDGCKVLVITFPPIINENHLWGAHPFFKETGVDKSLEGQRDIVRNFAAENGYPLLDLYKILYPNRYEYLFEDGVHLNPKGQRVFAEEAFKVIAAQNWI